MLDVFHRRGTQAEIDLGDVAAGDVGEEWCDAAQPLTETGGRLAGRARLVSRPAWNSVSWSRWKCEAMPRPESGRSRAT